MIHAMRLPLKQMFRTARRPEEDPVGVTVCPSCEADPDHGHETWCPTRLDDVRARFRAASQPNQGEPTP